MVRNLEVHMGVLQVTLLHFWTRQRMIHRMSG